MIRVYGYDRCSTCRKAVQWLEAKGIEFELKAIKETPPSKKELAEMLGHYGGELRRLFNTSGMDYREMGLKDRLPEMGRDEAFELLRGNGMLVKRPFLIGDGKGIVGFREQDWGSLLG